MTTPDSPSEPGLPGVVAPRYAAPEEAPVTSAPAPIKRLDPAARTTLEGVMARDVEMIAAELRLVRRPRRWIGRLASFFAGLALTAASAGVVGMIHDGTGQPAAPLAWRVGFFVAAGLALIFAIVLYAVDSGEAANPIEVCKRVLRIMEAASWIEPPPPTPGSAKFISRWMHDHGRSACPTDQERQ